MKHIITILALLLAPLVAPAAETKRPNIILVMADDQGWGDTGYNGHPELKTPHLDAMAAAGLRLNRFYTAHFNCSPTRASVMTGRHPHRMGTFSPGSPIRAQELTVAKVLQGAGYATGHFGKWHLNGKNGDRDTKTLPGRAILADDPLSPGKLGFDEWISADNFFDLDPVLSRNGVPEKFTGDGSDIATDEALKFIRKQAGTGKPFFTVVWFGNPHTPHEALPTDKAAYAALSGKEQNYYGEITGIDRNVGKLRAALRELKVADDTVLWYCSDNGGAAGPKSTGNLRGSKGTLWEGGLRVPGLIEWPARIAKPFASNVPCSTLDIFPTVLAATGAVAEKQIQPLDGVNLLPLFDRQMDARGKAIPFVAHITRPGSHAALLDWPYKLHTDAGAGRAKKAGKVAPLAPVLLYDVSKDPNETTDLAAQQPERVEKMKAELAAWKTSVEKSLTGADYGPQSAAPAPASRVASLGTPLSVSSKTNIILIMADDFGYECVTANGGQSYQTPNLDRLAAVGMRFEQCHVQPLCTPTRVQLMTGRYNVRNYLNFGTLARSETTFAHLLKQAGYATGICGKWQLGREPDAPKHFGFDESYLWQHTRRPPRYANPGLEHNGVEKEFPEGSYGPKLVNDFALDFVTRHKAQPFFLYYPMMLTHDPFQATPDSGNWDPKAQGEKANKNVKHFADMTAYMDKMIGRLDAKLGELGIRENTLLLFIGDNGTHPSITSRFNGTDYKGGKGTTTKRGHHVPMIVSWPAIMKEGRASRDLISSTDFLPTLCEAAGVKVPANVDGVSFLPQLRGEKGAPREWLYHWYSPRQGRDAAVREFVFDHEHKLYRDGRLFDLKSDPFEMEPLNPAALTDNQTTARGKLQTALDQFKDARPAEMDRPVDAETKAETKAQKKNKKTK